MAYFEELFPEFRNGAKIRQKTWKDTEYIYFKHGIIYGEDGNEAKTPLFYYNLFNGDDWEFYQDPIDWDYIIKNKVLCWFWNGGIEQEQEPKPIGNLVAVNEAYVSNIGVYDNCCPVCKNEVIFYEDKE